MAGHVALLAVLLGLMTAGGKGCIGVGGCIEISICGIVSWSLNGPNFALVRMNAFSASSGNSMLYRLATKRDIPSVRLAYSQQPPISSN